ncbi:MAG: aldo/keto reductase [Clostridiales bacterium]|nr:aldo/keto reductase [Clostridiales bacterium]
MEYRKFGNTGVEISALGLGCMRFPTTNEPMSPDIDVDEAIKMIHHAIDEGVNYLDTAYPYHGGQSEIVVGKSLKGGYREKVYLATKAPVWMINREEDFEINLDEQLRKLDVEYIDFYLLHALSLDRWNNTILKHNVLGQLEKAKAAGKIKHVGFSFHDDYNAFQTIVDGYDKWEFCQIQFNYIDIHNQAELKGLKYAASKGLGVIVMEPLLGGKLATPPAGVAKVLSDTKTPVEWAFDFIWDFEEVSFLLSGMGSMEQIKENLVYASRSSVGKLSEDDLKMLEHAKVVYDTMALVPCTKCAYCMPCPFGLDIPKIYEAYNKTASVGLREAKEIYQALEISAEACQQCKECEKVCPQKIMSSDLMSEIHKVFI